MTQGTSPGGLRIEPLDRHGTAIDAFTVDCVAAEERREDQDECDADMLFLHSAAPSVWEGKSPCAREYNGISGPSSTVYKCTYHINQRVTETATA